MIELPEAYTIAAQLEKTFKGKTIVSAVANTSPHSFAWYSGNPELYNEILSNRKVAGAKFYGGRPEMHAAGMIISFLDGVRFRYLTTGEKRPEKHQLLLEFDDDTALACTIQMYGGLLAFEDKLSDDFYYNVAKEKPSPFTDAFDKKYFDNLLSSVKQNMSVKAFLATEQRIPGFGNGVLHDTLYGAKIHPKTKLEKLLDSELDGLYNSVKNTLLAMKKGGGRDTEKDLFGNNGGYKTILSNKTLSYQCPMCGGGIVRQAYLGGNIYFCPNCQPLKK